MWRDLLVAAGIPHVRQHTVRHSTATLLLEAGVDAHIIQQVIGHANVAMTRSYQHVNLDLARQAFGNLAAIMPSA
jgi:site-specific recombinase XerD